MHTAALSILYLHVFDLSEAILHGINLVGGASVSQHCLPNLASTDYLSISAFPIRSARKL